MDLRKFSSLVNLVFFPYLTTKYDYDYENYYYKSNEIRFWRYGWLGRERYIVAKKMNEADQYCQPAQNQPKYQIMFHKKYPPRDLCKMTLRLAFVHLLCLDMGLFTNYVYKWVGSPKMSTFCQRKVENVNGGEKVVKKAKILST